VPEGLNYDQYWKFGLGIIPPPPFLLLMLISYWLVRRVLGIQYLIKDEWGSGLSLCRSLINEP
jgi:hypothetical protein